MPSLNLSTSNPFERFVVVSDGDMIAAEFPRWRERHPLQTVCARLDESLKSHTLDWRMADIERAGREYREAQDERR